MTRILTVGHSTMSSSDLVALLRAHGVTLVADVRRYPGSRRHPQFGRERLAETLAAAGIRYEHVESLGGRRSPRPDSPNSGLRDELFRGFADHMATAGFRRALSRLVEGAWRDTVAVLCAEADPFRCHRRLIADALTLDGVDVEHITGPGARLPHERTEGLRAEGGAPVYRAPEQPALPLEG